MSNKASQRLCSGFLLTKTMRTFRLQLRNLTRWEWEAHGSLCRISFMATAVAVSPNNESFILRKNHAKAVVQLHVKTQNSTFLNTDTKSTTWLTICLPKIQRERNWVQEDTWDLNSVPVTKQYRYRTPNKQTTRIHRQNIVCIKFNVMSRLGNNSLLDFMHHRTVTCFPPLSYVLCQLKIQSPEHKYTF